MASPSPVPPKRCAVVASGWLNSSRPPALTVPLTLLASADEMIGDQSARQQIAAIAFSDQYDQITTLRSKSFTMPSVQRNSARTHREKGIWTGGCENDWQARRA
jgi:hypothetical protein